MGGATVCACVKGNNGIMAWPNSEVAKNLLGSLIFRIVHGMKLGMDMENIMISLDIFDHDCLKPSDRIGSIRIGKNADTKLGTQHWAEVLKYPQQRISFWHPI